MFLIACAPDWQKARRELEARSWRGEFPSKTYRTKTTDQRLEAFLVCTEAGLMVRAIEGRLASWTVDRRVDCVRVADATQSALAATHIFEYNDNAL